MAKVVGLTMVGGAYHNGHYCPGWDIVHLDNDTQFTVPDSAKLGMSGVLDIADQRGHDTKSYRQRLEVWVKTGTMPEEEITFGTLALEAYFFLPGSLLCYRKINDRQAGYYPQSIRQIVDFPADTVVEHEWQRNKIRS